jgi:enoyl-CoA hydratase/carnithine racemase
VSNDRVTTTVDGGVADVRLVRADKLNAVDVAMFHAIAEAGDALRSQPGVRAVVVSGEGRAFCAGIDTTIFTGGNGDAAPPVGVSAGDDRTTNLFQEVAYVWSELPVPVIAAVHGVCFGAGLQIAMGADIRFATADARLSVMEIKWGLFPDMTGTLVLPRLVGLDVAIELATTGRIVSGEEAHALGLVTHVVDDPRAEALELARAIAARNPAAVRAAKRLLRLSGTRPAAEQLADERATIASIVGTPNQVEAIMANVEQRDPSFSDP